MARQQQILEHGLSLLRLSWRWARQWYNDVAFGVWCGKQISIRYPWRLSQSSFSPVLKTGLGVTSLLYKEGLICWVAEGKIIKKKALES